MTHLHRTLRALPLICLVALASGCAMFHHGGDGDLTMGSLLPDGPSLQGHFTTAVYRFDGNNELSVLLLDGPIENPTQAVTVRMLWSPHPGKTPIDPTATNATIHYIIFSGQGNQQIGIYSGAGYLFPNNNPGGASLSAGVWQASLRLTDRSDAFKDLLGPASLQGKFSARRDDAQAEDLLRQLNVLVHRRLGFPRLVEKDSARDLFDLLDRVK